MLPKAVREAADKADAIHNQLSGKTEGNPAPEQPQQTAEAAPAAEAPPAEQAVQQPPAPQPDSWEHKYRVLSNKYSAEVPRYAQEVRELKEKLREAEAKQAAAPAMNVPADLTPDKIVEQYGEDFANAVASVAARMAEERIGKFRDEFAPKVDTAVNHAAVTGRQAFMQQLTNAVPDWATIDQEDGFTAYLDEVDEMTGRTRREFFAEADRNNDAMRIVKFFTNYRERSAPKTALKQQVASNAVEYALSPSSVRTNEVPAGKKVWSQPEIRKFYNDARRGTYSPEEFKRIESDIFAAQVEGRLLAA
jgi:hypothetical protein